jgi:hypothetical protein
MLSRCSERYAQMLPRQVQYPGCNSLSENNSLYLAVKVYWFHEAACGKASP